jgi:hypothetical protein
MDTQSHRDDLPAGEKPVVEQWMVDAAIEIDQKLGLPRHDLAIQWAAEIVARHAEQNAACRGKNAR